MSVINGGDHICTCVRLFIDSIFDAVVRDMIDVHVFFTDQLGPIHDLELQICDYICPIPIRLFICSDNTEGAT